MLWPDASVWRGKQAVLDRLDEVARAVGGGSVEFESVRAQGDEVLVAMRWRLEHERADAALGSVVHLVEVRDHSITAIRVFLDERRAAEAARSPSS